MWCCGFIIYCTCAIILFIKKNIIVLKKKNYKYNFFAVYGKVINKLFFLVFLRVSRYFLVSAHTVSLRILAPLRTAGLRTINFRGGCQNIQTFKILFLKNNMEMIRLTTVTYSHPFFLFVMHYVGCIVL